VVADLRGKQPTHLPSLDLHTNFYREKTAQGFSVRARRTVGGEPAYAGDSRQGFESLRLAYALKVWANGRCGVQNRVRPQAGPEVRGRRFFSPHHTTQ